MTITRKLEEAKVLLEEKQKVSDVASYLSKCRVSAMSHPWLDLLLFVSGVVELSSHQS